ncbi:hypothetical protein [Macrococcoides caseolyticum]|nr:hypothetical protein [Macrococcus caseolyticus]
MVNEEFWKDFWSIFVPAGYLILEGLLIVVLFIIVLSLYKYIKN